MRRLKSAGRAMRKMIVEDQYESNGIKQRKLQCAYCGFKDELEVDHILPLSRGGKDEPNNLQMLCKRCNRTKDNQIHLRPKKVWKKI